jgi:hypothetical protein
MCFLFIPKMAWTASSWTSALVAAGSLQPHRKRPPLLKTSFFRQVRELKIQRKNPGNASRVEVNQNWNWKFFIKSKEPPNTSKYTPCSIDFLRNSPILLTLWINIFREFSHGNPQKIDCGMYKFFLKKIHNNRSHFKEKKLEIALFRLWVPIVAKTGQDCKFYCPLWPLAKFFSFFFWLIAPSLRDKNWKQNAEVIKLSLKSRN